MVSGTKFFRHLARSCYSNHSSDHRNSIFPGIVDIYWLFYFSIHNIKIAIIRNKNFFSPSLYRVYQKRPEKIWECLYNFSFYGFVFIAFAYIYHFSPSNVGANYTRVLMTIAGFTFAKLKVTNQLFLTLILGFSHFFFFFSIYLSVCFFNYCYERVIIFLK